MARARKTTGPPRSHKQDILHMHSQKNDQKKPTVSSELAGKHLLNGKQRVWFELWYAICFHVGVTFIIHKPSPHQTRKMKKKDCHTSVKVSHTNAEKRPYLSSQEEPGFFGLLVWDLVLALSNQPLRNVELPADIPYLLSQFILVPFHPIFPSISPVLPRAKLYYSDIALINSSPLFFI